MTDSAPTPPNGPQITRSLSAKLLLLTFIFIMIAEVLIFVPSIANFRNVWLQNHLEIAEAASIVYFDSQELMLSDEAQSGLLETTKSRNIAVKKEGISRLIASEGMTPEIYEHIDLNKTSALSSINSAFTMLTVDPMSKYRVFADMQSEASVIELVQEVRHIQAAMWIYSRNILILSLLVSILAGALLYLALYRLIVSPIVRISSNMDAFSKSPEDATLILKPTGRNDEIGVAENRLAFFQTDLRNTLRQKKHLADLGLAVAKINHDLRNILASAQLFSDRLSSLPDPTVQRFAPKLIRTIDRAVGYTKAVIDYGKAVEAPPNRRKLALKNLADEVAELLGLDSTTDIQWDNRIADDFEADADPEHLFRVLLNLSRNATQAMKDAVPENGRHVLSVMAEKRDQQTHIRICDTGPGIPDHVREKIFSAFQGSTRSGGTGLGITIASELVRAHGGQMRMEETGERGTTFHIIIPDVIPAGEGDLLE